MIKMVQDSSYIVKVVYSLYWVSKVRDVYNNCRGMLTSCDKSMLLVTGLR